MRKLPQNARQDIPYRQIGSAVAFILPMCYCTYAGCCIRLRNNGGNSRRGLLAENHGQLPGNYITKDEAKTCGWTSQKGNLSTVAPGKAIGGDRYFNGDGHLPSAPGRIWYEADINYSSGFRTPERIVYSSDGLIFVTYDHYESFVEVV